jgi:hypothetical protein
VIEVAQLSVEPMHEPSGHLMVPEVQPELATHWSTDVLQFPSSHITGVSVEQMIGVGQSVPVCLQEPSEQRIGLEVGQTKVSFRTGEQREVSFWHSLFQHLICPVGQDGVVGQRDLETAHELSGQCNIPEGHVSAAAVLHWILDRTQLWSWHLIGISGGQVIKDGQSWLLALHSPLPHLYGKKTGHST